MLANTQCRTDGRARHLPVDELEDSYAEDPQVADSHVAAGDVEWPPADMRVAAPSGRSEAVRWVISLVIVAACHGAGALALMRNDPIAPEVGVDAPVVMLDLQDALSAAPVQELPPGPPMDEAPQAPQPKEETRPPEIEAEVTPPPELEPPPPRPPEPPAEVALPLPKPEPPKPPEPKPAEEVHAPAPARTPPRTVVRWQSQLGAHIDRFKRYPAGARRGGTATISFTIDRRGRLLQSGIVRSAGAPALDQEALATLARAAPMPPPPDEVTDAELTFTLPVHFNDR